MSGGRCSVALFKTTVPLRLLAAAAEAVGDRLSLTEEERKLCATATTEAMETQKPRVAEFPLPRDW